jgi:hypothetical protein
MDEPDLTPPPNGGRRRPLGRRAVTSGADQTSVRRHNLSVVLQHVATRGARSRARIAAETGFNKTTVSSLISELIDRGLIRETGLEENPGSVGRPAQTVELEGNGVVAIGLEVNVDHLSVCASDLGGTVRYRKLLPDSARWPARRSTPSRPRACARWAWPWPCPGWSSRPPAR